MNDHAEAEDAAERDQGEEETKTGGVLQTISPRPPCRQASYQKLMEATKLIARNRADQSDLQAPESADEFLAGQ